MKHEIDLSKFNVYTDLTIESIKNNKVDNIDVVEKIEEEIKVTEVIIDEESSKKLNKKKGKYVTIEFDDVTDEVNFDKVKEVFKKELQKFINLSKEELVLIVGLGNEYSTADSLGPLSINEITVTNHLYELDMLDDNYYRVCAIAPSVTGKTGIETFKIIKSIVKSIKPGLVIVIDSLASSSLERLNRTIQITDTGISPGSGIGNKRKEISYKTLNTPVIAIGIPTVVGAASIVHDTIKYVLNHFDNNKQDLLGLMGKLSSEELHTLFTEVLTDKDFNLVVTPTEIDYLVESLSHLLASTINEIFKGE